MGAAICKREGTSYHMGKFTGVLLASDYDNTLLHTAAALLSGGKAPEISRNNCQAIVYFMDHGGRFAVATGRALAALESFVDQIPMNAPAVICNGAALYDFQTREYLDYILLDDAMGRRCQETLERFPSAALEAYPLLESVIHAVRPNAYTRQHQHLTHTTVCEHTSLLEVPGPLSKVIFEDSHTILEEIQQSLHRQPWISACEMSFTAPTLLELTGKGACKGGMVRRLADRLGISMEHVYCVGDEANDLSMLTAAAEGFAPANCVDAVRRCGATIVADCSHDALAQVIEILDKRYK